MRISKVSLFCLICFMTIAVFLGVTANAATITVSTGAELQNAIMNATAGTTILVSPGTYTVPPTTITLDNGIGGTVSRTWFFGGSQTNGTSTSKIILKSADPANPAILDGAGWDNAGYTLYIRGDYWEIRDLKIRSGAKGLILDNANYCTLDNLEVYEMGQEAIHVRDGSCYTLIDNCFVHDSGKLNDGFGEGVYIGSDNSVWADGDGVNTGEKGRLYNKECHYNTVKNSTLGPSITAEPIEIKEGTTNTIFEYCIVRGPGVSGNNYADSHFDIKGCQAIIRYCTFYQDDNTKITQSGMIVARQNAGVPDAYTARDNYIHDNVMNINSGTYILKVNSGSANIYAWNNTKNPDSGNKYSGSLTQSCPAGYTPPGGTAPTPTPTSSPVVTVTPTPTISATPSTVVTPTPTPTPTTTPASGTNLALNKLVTYSSQQSGNEASKIVDGSTITRWSADTYPEWICVDLGAVYSINQTELAPYSNRAYQYKIEVSTNNSSFTQVVDRTSNTNSSSLLADTFGSVNGRYVRLTITGCYNYTGTWASINEFRIFGSGTTVSPSPTATVTPTPTVTTSPMPTATVTPSATPTATVVPTPTPSSGSGSFTVQYDCDETVASSNKIKPLFKIVNTGSTALDISKIKVRYYYTIDSEIAQSFFIDYASGVTSSNCVGTFVKLATAKTGADYYMELSFKTGAGTIAPGGSIQVKTRWSKSDYSNYTQVGDFSFDPTKTSYTDWNKTPGYYNGVKTWGIEP